MINENLEASSLLSVTLFKRQDGERTEEVYTEILDVFTDAYQYIIDNSIKVSADPADNPYIEALIYFADGNGTEIAVNSSGLPCEEIMDMGVKLLKEKAQEHLKIVK